ncbi:MAG: sulfur carrier protein ThiS [Longimicrobiaceae bacterium]
MNVNVNGDDREVPAGLDVGALLERLELLPELVVVEKNGEIVRRGDYAGTPVEEGDRFELVHFVGGG